jgi:hypothetical protein
MTILPVGPYKVIKLAGGGEMPWYMMPFDHDGVCTGPETRKHLMAAVAKEPVTDIYPLDLKKKAWLYGVDGTATISGHGDIGCRLTGGGFYVRAGVIA